MIEKKISQFHFYGNEKKNLDFRKIESAIAGQCFKYALNNYNYKYYTQKWLVFKQEKTIFCNDDAVPKRPHPLI